MSDQMNVNRENYDDTPTKVPTDKRYMENDKIEKPRSVPPRHEEDRNQRSGIEDEENSDMHGYEGNPEIRP